MVVVEGRGDLQGLVNVTVVESHGGLGEIVRVGVLWS